MNGSYDLGLVALSVLVAMLASYGALDFASRVALAPRNSSRVWVALGGCVMGFGIWSMHFIGMLAFSLPTRLAYDPALTAASLGIAILTSGFALAIVGYLAVMGRSEIDFAVLAAGGVLMGAGICAMHYTGMAAMRMTPPIIYAPLPYAASMVIAVVASIAALWLSFRQLSEPAGRRAIFRVLSAVVMGLAIAGMHYTGMVAAQFAPNAVCAVADSSTLTNSQLAYAIGFSVLLIVGVTLAAPWVDARSGENAALGG
jgi:diguanylate cyclase